MKLEKPEIGKSNAFEIGKSTFIITRPAENLYMVMRYVRKAWVLVESARDYQDALNLLLGAATAKFGQNMDSETLGSGGNGVER